MIAALPMYDWPEIAGATDAFWTTWRDRLRARGVDAPERLTRDQEAWSIWRAPDLLVAQTCGWPYVSALRKTVRLVATPCYDVPGCEGPRYASWLIVRRDDPAETVEALSGRVAAVNDRQSQSGWRAIGMAGVAPGAVRETGAHRASALAVADGQADFAAIDCVSWAHFETVEQAAATRLRHVAATPSAPALPFVTRGDAPDALVATLRETLTDTLHENAGADWRRTLRLSGVESLSDADYAPLLEAVSAA